jgi:hypothetical protein
MGSRSVSELRTRSREGKSVSDDRFPGNDQGDAVTMRRIEHLGGLPNSWGI